MTKWVVVALAAVALAGRVAAADASREIVVEENEKTTDETVLLIADVETGDDFQPSRVDEIKKNLENSGLFKEYDVYWDPLPEGGIRLHIIAKDKHPWVIAPTAYNQPTNKGGGVGFGHNNLFGEQKKLLLYGQVATGDSFFIGAYVDPSIAGSLRFHWQADVFLKSARVIEYESPTDWFGDVDELRKSRLNYLNGGVKAGVNLWAREPVIALDLRFRGAHVSYSSVDKANAEVPIEDITGDATSTDVPAPGAEGWDISSEVSLGFDTRANAYGVTTGTRLKVSFEQSIPAVGSDFDYWYSTARLDIARKFLARHNLILKLEADYGRNMPFQQEFLVGGTTMRGWKNGQFHGNLRFGLNAEYSVPLFTISGLGFRALGFWDSAYITFTRTDEAAAQRDYLPNARWDWKNEPLAPFKNSVGVGMRLFLKQIVIPLLGLDFGYGIERRGYEIYIAIGLTD